ncbi:unnamed protein product [Caenorhabditis auriculariae]|uniref:Uncharacterized protein n=1 Tax=Caenorhabditis auriculariae TaxID=2777116 RepID=A0A8S1GQ14_9PELO|nr:unnamed protein product [Caenorhabditis auriculariae]
MSLLHAVAIGSSVVISTIFTAIALFTDGWLFVEGVCYGDYCTGDIGLGLTPYPGGEYMETQLPDWLLATCWLMYFTFAIDFICLIVTAAYVFSVFNGSVKMEKMVLLLTSGVTAVTALLGLIAFVVFEAGYGGLDGLIKEYVKLGFSSFMQLVAFLFAIIACAISIFRVCVVEDQEY